MWQWLSWQFRHRARVFVHRIRFPGQPMFTEPAARDLRGKTVLVNVTRLDAEGTLLEEDEFYGRIEELDERALVVRNWAGEERRLPPDLRALFPAKPGTIARCTRAASSRTLT